MGSPETMGWKMHPLLSPEDLPSNCNTLAVPAGKEVDAEWTKQAVNGFKH